ncbi:MAG: phosphatidylglycerophosphatase A [Acetobacteraceae bacterium]|nr:phosphatidylglycerophosphatase A [Acetobacteraceae bacterium]
MTLARWIASGGGIGHVPAAPGTVASLAALAIGTVAFWLNPHLLIWLAIVSTLIGTWAIHATKEQNDPGWIVIDEFAGQWIALLGLTHLSLYGLIAAFALFRFLDITKLGPVGWADRKQGAIAVMADDVVAGVIVAAVLFIAENLFPRL